MKIIDTPEISKHPGPRSNTWGWDKPLKAEVMALAAGGNMFL